MSIKTVVPQPSRSQGNSDSTKYVNKVTLSANGSMSVVATPVAKNTAPTTTASTAKSSSTNQIAAGSKTVRIAAATLTQSRLKDSDGFAISPEPPGPPPDAVS
jgi:hypothetical protein